MRRQSNACRILLLGSVCAFLAGCDPDLEEADFNVYFYYPDNREVYLRAVRGISACRRRVTGGELRGVIP